MDIMTTGDNNSNTMGRNRLTVRVSRYSLSFSTVEMMPEGDNKIVFEPYTVKSGISMAANLREALKTAALPARGIGRVTVMVDSPVLLVPADMFRAEDCALLYAHSYPYGQNEVVLHNVLPELNVVAAFAVNKDFKLVIDDHYRDAQFMCAMLPVWRYLYQRSFVGSRSKMFGYFHDRKVDVFSFGQNRFKFCNSFAAPNAKDALYYLLNVWNQLMLKPEYDEMHIVGDIPEREWMVEELRRYLQRAYTINPSGDFNRAPATRIKGMPYDLVTYYVRGK